MALSLAQVNVAPRTYVNGDRLEVITDFTCDNLYPSGGYSLTPAQLGLIGELDFLNANVQAGPTATISSFSYDYVNQKLKCLAGGSEVAASTDLHTVVGRLVAKGKGFATYSGV